MWLFKSTLANLALAIALLLTVGALIAPAQVAEPRAAGLTYNKTNLSAIVFHNTSADTVSTTVEVVDSTGQVLMTLSEVSAFGADETKSVSASVLPAEAAGIRVGDNSIALTFRYDLGDGRFADLNTLDTKPTMVPAESDDDVSGRSKPEASSRMAAAMPRAASAPSCGGLSSPGNPFPCSNGGNCVWFAWKMAAERWQIDFPARGDARTWPSAATSNYFRVLSSPAVDTIAMNTTQRDSSGQLTGHVGWTVSVSGNTVCTREMSWGVWGERTVCRDRSYWNGGFVYPPSIAVSSPNSYTSWTVNSNQWVNWSYTGTPGGSVRIELVKPAVLQGNDSVWVLAYSVSLGSRGTGSALVRVPNVPRTGGPYYIRVVSTSLPRYWAASPYFWVR